MTSSNEKRPRDEAPEVSPETLTVEELEARIAPTAIDKKVPIPPPYPPGADYGLIRRENLRW